MKIPLAYFAARLFPRHAYACSVFSSAANNNFGHMATSTTPKWRLCAGVVVFNSKNQILIGERLGRPNSWQTPQGGVDENESIAEAAARELFEEVGLKVDKHVILSNDPPQIKCKYSTAGSNSWLEKEGYLGQELNFIMMRCSDARLERDPGAVCILTGLNGESQEFTAVKWESLDWVVDNVWEQKRQPYEALREGASPLMKQWDEQCRNFKAAGKWSRDPAQCTGVVEALVSRGLTEEAATKSSQAPYVQEWEIQEDRREWMVTTFEEDGLTPRRKLLYPMGDFSEHFSESTLFGQDSSEVHRSCFYLASKIADDGISHVTVSKTPRGVEESHRYLKDGAMVLRRVFSRSATSKTVESIEFFRKVVD